MDSAYAFRFLAQLYHSDLKKRFEINVLLSFKCHYGALQIYVTNFLRFKGMLVIPSA